MKDVCKRLRHTNSLFDRDQILEIRRRLDNGESQSSIARDYNTRPSVIHNIKYRKTYGLVR